VEGVIETNYFFTTSGIVHVPVELMSEIKQYAKDHKKLQLASG